jgi:hypothetical protein
LIQWYLNDNIQSDCLYEHNVNHIERLCASTLLSTSYPLKPADMALYPALSADAPPAQKPSPTYTPKASSSSKKRPTSSSSTSGPKRPRPSPLPVQAHVSIP